MKVRSGWNSEYARKKYDVEVDEADLARILTSSGIPLEAMGSLTMAETHDILYYTAEGLARLALGRYDKSMAESCAAEFKALQAKRAEVLARVKSRQQSDAEKLQETIAAVRLAKEEARQSQHAWDAGWPPQDEG